MAYAIDRVMLSFVFVFGDANSLYGKQCVLWATVAFFADAGLLAPEVAVDGVALCHFVVAVALGEVHAAAVGKFPEQAEHLPLDVSRRTLGRIAEEDLVLDF